MKSRLYIISALLLMVSCRGELPLMRAEGELVDDNPGSSKNIKGLYLLNEGNMGSNKCTIDFFDTESSSYFRNIYAQQNPEVVKELGDVGNDIQIYDGKLFAVINCSPFHRGDGCTYGPPYR